MRQGHGLLQLLPSAPAGKHIPLILPSPPPPSPAPPTLSSQCTGANPRYPLIADLRQLLVEAWQAPIVPRGGLRQLRRWPTCLTSKMVEEALAAGTPPSPLSPSRLTP